MNKLFVLCAVGALLAQPVAVFAQTTSVPPGTTTTATPMPMQPGTTGVWHKGEDYHPEIRRAIKRLDEAKDDLQRATHDYDGHREQALQLIDQAEAQLNLSLQDASH